MPTLRFLTLNVWHGIHARSVLSVEKIEPEGHKERRRRALAAALRELDPDVLFLQECHPQPAFSAGLADELGYDSIDVVCNAGVRVAGRGIPLGIGTGEGLAILARRGLGLRRIEQRRLAGWGWVGPKASFHLTPNHYCLAAEISFPGRRVVLFDAHLLYMYPSVATFQRAWRQLRKLGGLGRGQAEPPAGLVRKVGASVRLRDRQVWALERAIREHAPRGVPFVLGADLNLEPDSHQVMALVESLDMTNVLPTLAPGVRTWRPAENPNVAWSTTNSWPDGRGKGLVDELVAHYDRAPQTPDHLMLGPSFGPDSVAAAGTAVCGGQDGTWPSDHCGIYCDLRF